jgi:hypothetical protein
MRFDLRVVQYSMLVDLLSHALVVAAPLPSRNASAAWWSQFMFVGATSISCAGGGVMPGMQSLALCTLQGRALATKEIAVRAGETQENEADAVLEPGKLFGALAVTQAIGQTILGVSDVFRATRALSLSVFLQPMIFGVIYSSTVASFPKAIFAVACGLVLVSIAFTIFVRPDVSLSMVQRKKVKAKSKAIVRPPVVRKPKLRYQEINRGRSRVSKDLRGGAARADYGSSNQDDSSGSGSGSSLVGA